MHERTSNHVWCAAAAVAALLAIIPTAAGQAPKVVELSPPNEATDVDPGTKELRVTFDRDMSSKGFSFCGGGPAFPPIQGNPRWITKRTIVGNVKLEPDRDYQFSLNCPAGQNFRSAQGVPLEPVAWSFSTAARAARLSKTEQKKLNERCLKELLKVLREHYSYYELRKLDWKGLEKRHHKAIVESGSTRAWVKEAAKMLSAAKDPHLWLNYRSHQTPTHIRKGGRNVSLEGVKTVLPDLKQRNGCVHTAKTKDGIGYIMITSLSQNFENELGEVQDVLEEFLNSKGNCKAVVLDLRANGGGSEPLAVPIAAWFVKGEKVYSKNAYRDPKSKTGFGEVFDRTIKGNDPPRRFDKPAAVLIGPGVMSSAESFVLMLKQGEHVTTVGAATYGSSGNPKSFTLENEVEVFVPSWKDMLPDGTCIEGRGIKPDTPVKTKQADLKKGDPVLERALEVLREKIKK